MRLTYSFRAFFGCMASILSIGSQGQLVVDHVLTPMELLTDVLLGPGVTATNVTFNGGSATVLHEQAGRFNGINSNIGIDSGLVLSSGNVSVVAGANFVGSNTLGGGHFGYGDQDLSQLNGLQTNDAAILEFDFVPTGDSLSFRYVFSSEEYNEYVCGSVNDAFGFFLSGPGIAGPFSNNAINIALIPGTNVPVTINTVNLGVSGIFGNPSQCAALDPNWTSNNIYYTDNTGGLTVESDGFTVVLTAQAVVQCGETYHIKLAIADGGDTAFDSGVFLESGSFKSNAAVTASLTSNVGLLDSTLYEGCAAAYLSFARFGGDYSYADTVEVIVSGTATNGVDFSPYIPGYIVFPVGDSVLTLQLEATVDGDGPETVNMTMVNIAETCAGLEIVSGFTFYINEALPMYITLMGDTTIDCDDVLEIAPVVYEGYGNYTYAWSTGETTPSISASPPVTTTYTVTVGDTCGIVPQTASVTITVPIYPPIEATVGPDVTLNCLEPHTFHVLNATGGDGVFNYTWRENGNVVVGTGTSLDVIGGDTTAYLVEVGAGCGVSDVDTVWANELPLAPIELSFTPDTTARCIQDTVTLNLFGATGGNGVYTYAWNTASGDLLNATTALTVVVEDTVGYTITVTDQCGNQGSHTIWTYTPQYKPLQLLTASDTAICVGHAGEIWAYAEGGAGGYTYSWPTINKDGTGPFIRQPEVDSVYTVEVRDVCDTVRTAHIRFDVQEITADMAVSWPSEFVVDLRDNSGPSPHRWQWWFGDGEGSTQQHAQHGYTDLLDHEVTLIVWNPIGCVDSLKVQVLGPAQVYVPNGFSPNGDGVNERFAPVGTGITRMEMTIYDRWGHQVFYSADAGQPWDGRAPNGELLQGTYVYRLVVEGERFGPKEMLGTVSVGL
jgi:gliding motility-associated-like protein